MTAPLKILLVDDDKFSYVMTRHLLSRIEGWQVQLDWCRTYEQGLKTICGGGHDLYLIDYRLDSRDGLDLLRDVGRCGCPGPMIMLTASKDREVDVQAMQAGAADYLVKDELTAATLERCIRYTLEHKRLNDALAQRARDLQMLAGQLSEAEQRERSRVARLLHDHLQQILVSAKMQVENLTPENVAERRRIVQRLLDQMMGVSRTLTVELTPPILMDAGLAAALQWLGKWMQQKYDLVVRADIDSAAEPAAEAVRLLLFHALRELLFNVAQHAQVRQGQLIMDIAGDDQVRICVADEGVGFDAAMLTQNSGRSGFGLAHLRERIRLIGGSLQLTTSPGRGCEVTLLAPRHPFQHVPPPREKAAPAEPAAAGDGMHSANPGRRIRVLIVDDHAIVRQGLALTLGSQEDIEVVGEAADGEQAIEMARQLKPDVVVMDVVMPRMNGIDATRWIAHQLPSVRVVGLSMYADAEMADAMRKSGAVAYLSKGAPTDALVAQLRGFTRPIPAPSGPLNPNHN